MKRRWITTLGGLGLLVSPAWGEPPTVSPYLARAGRGSSYVPCPPPVMAHPQGQCLPAPPPPGLPALPPLPGAAVPAPGGRPATPPGSPATPGGPPSNAPGSANAPGGQTPGAPGAAGAAGAQNAPSDPGAPSERGAEAPASLNANMFGDVLGGPTQQVIVNVPRSVPLSSQFKDAAGNPLNFPIRTDPTTGAVTFLTPTTTTVAGQPLREDFRAAGGLVQNNARNLVYPLLVNRQEEMILREFAQRTISPNGQLVYNSDPNKSFADPVNGVANITTTYDYNFLVPQAVELLAPSPTNGGVIGRTKIADDNSPLPRDRVIGNYDYFDNAPLTPRGIGVHRFSPGIEKTFFDRQASIEVRVPFAATLSNEILSDGSTNTRDAEFGNLAIALKALVYGGETLNVAAGLGITLPTASATRIFNLEGSELIRINNEVVVLTPYWAYLYTPTPRFFFQNWYAIAFNVGGNPVLSDPDRGGLKGAGRLYDQHLLQIDAQLGYWLVDPGESEGWLRGLAPFAEVHWNAYVGTPNAVQTNNFTILTSNPTFSELNVSMGAIVALGDAVNLTFGLALPLLNEENRTFDYQLGVRATVFFGPTLRQNASQTRVSAF